MTQLSFFLILFCLIGCVGQPKDLGSTQLASLKFANTAETKVLKNRYVFKTRVRFTGEWRPLSSRAARMMTLYAKKAGDKPNRFNYKSEIRVAQGKGQYWLPVPEELVIEIDRFIKPNKVMIAECLLLGTEATQWTALMTGLELKTSFRVSKKD